MNRHHFILLLFSIICAFSHAQNKSKIQNLDSIQILRKLADDINNEMDVRFKYAKRASQLSNATKVDSIILRTNRVLSTVYLFSDNYEAYKKINFENLALSKKLNDSLAIAISNHNLGWYHHHSRIQNDSAYFYYSNAVKIYDKID